MAKVEDLTGLIGAVEEDGRNFRMGGCGRREAMIHRGMGWIKHG